MNLLLRILGGLLGAGKWLLKGLGKLLDWIFADWRNGPLLMLAILSAAYVFLIEPGLRADVATQTARADREAKNADDWMASADEWKRAHTDLIAEVADKQRAAAEADRANIARVKAEYTALNERTVDDYEARLAGSAAAAERLRDRLARAEAEPAPETGSLGSSAGVPGTYTARCQAFGAADCDGLLRQLPWVLAEAQANTDQLVSLQRYVAGSSLIDFGSEGAEVDNGR